MRSGKVLAEESCRSAFWVADRWPVRVNHVVRKCDKHFPFTRNFGREPEMVPSTMAAAIASLVNIVVSFISRAVVAHTALGSPGGREGYTACNAERCRVVVRQEPFER